MPYDWTQLARELGSLHDGGERGGTEYAQRALERLLGDEVIQGAVEHVVASRPGSELAMNVLSLLSSARAVELAYAIYRSSTADRAAMAVWLIKHVAHPSSVGWIAEFLAAPNVAVWGVGVLDQLLFTHRVEPEDVEHLVAAAEAHAIENVREQAAFIREYLARRARVGRTRDPNQPL